MYILGIFMHTLYVYIFLKYMYNTCIIWYRICVTRQNHCLSICILCQHLPWNMSTHLANVCICNFCACLLAPTEKLWTSTPDPGAPRRTPPNAGRWSLMLPPYTALTSNVAAAISRDRTKLVSTKSSTCKHVNDIVWMMQVMSMYEFKREYIDYMYICCIYIYRFWYTCCM